mgnify:CR=1 FL=1
MGIVTSSYKSANEQSGYFARASKMACAVRSIAVTIGDTITGDTAGDAGAPPAVTPAITPTLLSHHA